MLRRSGWDFVLAVERDSREPLYLQITRAIANEIARGRLRPGDVLPGTRTLAAAVNVNRVTVLTAYQELAAEGWITPHPARGCVVSPQLRDEPRARLPQPARPFDLMPPYELPSVTVVPRSPEHLRGTLVFGASSPDARLLDVEPLARAYRRALRRGGSRLLGYVSPHGQPRLRRAIADMLCTTRGMSASAAHVFVTRGSQMGIALTARALLRRGDAVAVEALGYRQVWQTFAAAGATVVPVAIDGDGLNTEALAAMLRRRPVAAVYVTPQHQFPTTVTMSSTRRHHLLELPRDHRFAIIEDDYNNEFHYDGEPPLPLAAIDRSGSVIHVGSFSRLLAPGVRLGFVAGPKVLLERLAAHREYLDMQGDAATEAAVAELLEDGEVQRHVRRVRRIYRDRRNLLASLLRDGFGAALDFVSPRGGVAVWVRAPGIDVDAWAAAALDRAVAFQTAREFDFDCHRDPCMRLGFACLDAEELTEATRRLRSAYGDLRNRQSA
jgi:GntR family transcriptional regulator/MocR family aminotransferase